MKKYLLPVLFISISVTAQNKDAALLQQYKFRTPNYRTVSLLGNAAGGYGSAYAGKADYNFQLNVLFTATRLVSTNNRYSTYSYEISNNDNFYKLNTATGTSRQTNAAAAIRLQAQTKNYKGQRFISTGYSGTLLPSCFKANNSNINKRSEAVATLEYNIGAGKGRIENVTDAQMAYNILNELKKDKLLAKDFTVEDAYSLAQTITNVNNTRLFDFRRKRIFELKQIDSLLHTKGLIQENSIAYFTTITDNWFYAFNEQRRHGTERYITLTPLVNLNNDKTAYNVVPDSTIKNFSKGAAVLLTAGIEKAVAKNIKQQLTKGIRLQHAYGYGKSKTTGHTIVSETEINSLYGFLNGFLHWGYYPNTRTVINTYLIDILSWDYLNANFSNSTNLSFNGNYFVNYNTRVIVNLYAGISINKNSNLQYSTFFGSSFNVGLQHFIR